MFCSVYNLFITFIVSDLTRSGLYVLANLENGEYYEFCIKFLVEILVML